jgi:hypothetical protein
MAASRRCPVTTDTTALNSVPSAGGDSVRVGADVTGRPKVADAPARSGSYLAASQAPGGTCAGVQSAHTARCEVRRAALAWRALRALEVVEKVLTADS